MELMEKWKTELFQDQALNKLFDQDLSQEQFMLLILTNYNMVQIGDIFTKLTSINQSIGQQLDLNIKNNYEQLITDLKQDDQSQQYGDQEQIQNALSKIRYLRNRIHDSFVSKYEKIKKLEPIGKNSQDALQMCKQFQKLQSHLSILKTLAPQSQNQVNIIDPFRVANELLEISQLPMMVRQFSFYINNTQYLKQVEESLQIKANRKFQDALQNKSLPELNQCLGIYYGLGKLTDILEMKANQILKQTAESYKILLSKELNQKSFINELKPQVKDDFNYLLQIWLIWQAIQSRDAHHLISYEQYLKESFPNIFEMVWNKYCEVLQQSIQIILDNSKFENNSKILIKLYPQIRDIYSEFLLVFQEQIVNIFYIQLLFPMTILMNIKIQDYVSVLLRSVDILQQQNQNQLILQLKENITNIANDVFVQDKGQQYLDKSLTCMTNFIDFIHQELDLIKLDYNSYKIFSTKLMVELSQLLQSFEGINITNELNLVLQLTFPKVIQCIVDHPLNHYCDDIVLEKLIIILRDFQNYDQFIIKTNSMNQKGTLNWKQYFKNENMLTDSLKFKDWDQKNLEIPEELTLKKDLTRTRNDDPYFKKESTQRNLQLLATFYCQQNKVNYQQGMLEVVVPFLLLKNKDFPLNKCYAYLNSFMNLYFPKVLESRVFKERKELAHVMSAIQFSEILLKYHCADFYNKIAQISEFNVSMVVTQWIMTLFAKQVFLTQFSRGSPIPIVFIIFDQFMQRNNPNYIFYLVVALFENKKKEIETMLDQDLEMLLPFLNKNLKNLQTEEDVINLFQVADAIFKQTPNSYDQMILQTSFHEKTVLSVEDVKELITISESFLSKCLFINPHEIVSILQQNNKQSNNDKIVFNLRIIDIRKEKEPKLKNFIDSKFIIKYKKFKEKYVPNYHYSIITDSMQSMNEAIKIADEIFQKGIKYISIVQGGFVELSKIIKHPKQDGCVVM